MLLQAGLLLLCVLWLLLCLRFYQVIARENVWQRRLIALGGGLGAGLIYVLGTLVMSLLKMPTRSELPAVEQVEDVRIQTR